MYARVITIALLYMLAVIGIEIAHRRPVISTDARMPVLVVPMTTPADRLEMHIGDVDFTNVPLKTAIDTLAIRSNSNLGADWNTLRTNDDPGGALPADWWHTLPSIGISSTQPITLHLTNPTLATALQAICDNIIAVEGERAGVGQDPAGLLLLGSANDNYRSVTTLPRFYNVDDLIGPAVRFHALPATPYQRYTYISLQARQELRQLAVAITPFVRQGVVGCFGRRLFVSGYLESHEVVADILNRLRNPIQLPNSTATGPALPTLPKLPEFKIPPGTTVRQAWEMWEKAGAGTNSLEIGPDDEETLSQTVDFVVNDFTVEEIAVELIKEYRWPFIVIRRGEEDDRVHVRRVPTEPVIRAYDVSAILAHPDGWIAEQKCIAAMTPRIRRG